MWKGMECVHVFILNAGFPPIREIRKNRELFEDFFQSGKIREKQGVLSQDQGKKFKCGNFFQNYFQTV